MTGIRKSAELGLVRDDGGWKGLLGFAIDELAEVESSSRYTGLIMPSVSLETVEFWSAHSLKSPTFWFLGSRVSECIPDQPLLLV